MSKLTLVLLAVLVWTINTQCPDGYYTNPSIPMPGSGTCLACPPLCKTCTNSSACATYVREIKGWAAAAQGGAPNAICGGTFNSPASGANLGQAYNSATDTCEYCTPGCKTCYVEVDLCIDCHSGWEYNPTSLSCVRAGLGLSATILAFSALALILGVVSCIGANKLS